MNKTKTDIEFEKMIAWAESTGAFPDLVAELRNRADQTGRAEAVELLKALQSVRRPFPSYIITIVLLMILAAAAIFTFNAVLGG